MTMVDETTLAPLDPERVLGDPPARAALRELARQLREAGFDGSPSDEPVIRLARGDLADAAAVRAALGPHHDALLACDALYERDGEVLLATRVFPARSVMTLLPPAERAHDVVYLGPDSIILLEHVWKHAGIGSLAADLGTGNGFLAAAMATRFDHVVAADISPRCVASAALVPVLNPHLEHRLTAMRLDVAGGLQRGAFDLVTANAPWVPEVAGPDGGPARLFAAGGPTGFELPRRFIDEAADLLAPGGRSFVACIDITLADGRRPVLEHAAVVEERGFDVEVVPTRLTVNGGFAAWAADRVAGALDARHVIVTVRRRS